MLEIHETAKESFDAAKEYAKAIGLDENLNDKLEYLGNYSDSETKCVIYPDFSKHSFAFSMFRLTDGNEEFWFNGGLIYHGDHDNGGDGGPPTFSVNLNPHNGWSIHT